MTGPDTGDQQRMLIVEEALRDREGHWFEYNRAAKAAIREASTMTVDMLGHRGMHSSVSAELDAMPHFRYTVWDQLYNHPQALRRYVGVGIHNYRFYRDLAAYLETGCYYDFVFAPTVVLHHLLAYHAVTAKYGGRQFGQLVLLIRNNIAVYDSDGSRSFRRTARLWRWAIRRFAPYLKDGRVRFVTDSARLANEYEELAAVSFAVLPHPTLIGVSSGLAGGTSRDANDTGPIRLFLPGPARYEKGVARLLEATKLLTALGCRKPIEVILQWREPFSLPDGGMIGPEDMRKFESEKLSFRIISSPLSSEDYLQELARAHLVILPYLRNAYYARISGVAVEAMTLGVPLLYTSNTWTATVCDQFGLGVPMSDDASGVARAIAASIDGLDVLTVRAQARAGHVRRHFSAGAFFEELLGTKTCARMTPPAGTAAYD